MQVNVRRPGQLGQVSGCRFKPPERVGRYRLPGDPEMSWTHERGRLNALQRHRPADDPEIEIARRDLRAARLEHYIRKAVDAAPPLTPAQRDRLALLLRQPGSTPAERREAQTAAGDAA
jgi:hypothetical protein